jgi:hypothetical protein
VTPATKEITTESQMGYESMAHELTSFREIEAFLEKIRNQAKYCDETAQDGSDDVEIREHNRRHDSRALPSLDVSV